MQSTIYSKEVFTEDNEFVDISSVNFHGRYKYLLYHTLNSDGVQCALSQMG